jgi:hypothetical protein
MSFGWIGTSKNLREISPAQLMRSWDLTVSRTVEGDRDLVGVDAHTAKKLIAIPTTIGPYDSPLLGFCY